MNNQALRSLPIEQRLHLVEDLWDSIAADQGTVVLSDAQRQLLDQRLDAFALDHEPGRPLQAAIAEIRQRL